MSELAVDREAVVWWEIFRANVEHARANGVVRPASTADPLIPTERLEFLASATTTQYITLGRDRESFRREPEELPSATAAPSGPKAGQPPPIPKDAPAFGDSRLNEKNGRLQWYLGICSTPECGKETWAYFDPKDSGLTNAAELRTPPLCGSCYARTQRRKP